MISKHVRKYHNGNNRKLKRFLNDGTKNDFNDVTKKVL